MIINLDNLYKHFSIIPLQDKVPITKDWPRFAKEKINYDRIKNHDDNFGVVCGYDNLEVIDIDNHFLDADKLLQYLKDNHNLDKFLIIKTQHGGYHIYYKCEKIEGNLKLANRMNDKGRSEALIETRGKGGQAVFYNNIIQGDINSVPVIDEEERDTLIAICRSLNEVEKKRERIPDVRDERPGDKYNNDLLSIQETINLLLQHGWQTRDDKHFKRPGKDTKGISATFGKVGKNKFYVFSSNADPFNSETSYSMFGVRTILLHNGNYSACAQELAKKYNIKPSKRRQSGNKKEPQKNNDKWTVLETIIKEWNLRFRYNEITKVLDVSVEDKDYQPLGLLPGDIIREMEVNRGIKTISMNKLMEMIGNQSICEVYNPIKSFISKLPEWNGEDNVAQLCKFIELHHEEKQDFFISMLKKHLIRTLKCSMIDKYINRMVLVFHGDQEIGKSMFFRWLIPNELYYEEPINPGDKDSILALSRYLVINLDELDSLNKKDVAKLKAFISRGEIVKRIAYGRHDERFPRITSFVASTNKSDILADTTNTRWIILKIKRFDWQNYIKKVDPIQIWAQILYELKKDSDSGELTIQEKQERDRRNSVQFLETSSEREILLKHFEETKSATGMTATDIKLVMEKELYPLKINIHQLVRELRRIFGEPQHTRVNGHPGRYYFISHNLSNYQENYKNFYETDKADSQQDVPF